MDKQVLVSDKKTTIILFISTLAIEKIESHQKPSYENSNISFIWSAYRI
jgi:hypothetical protein